MRRMSVEGRDLAVRRVVVLTRGITVCSMTLTGVVMVLAEQETLHRQSAGSLLTLPSLTGDGADGTAGNSLLGDPGHSAPGSWATARVAVSPSPAGGDAAGAGSAVTPAGSPTPLPSLPASPDEPGAPGVNGPHPAGEGSVASMSETMPVPVPVPATARSASGTPTSAPSPGVAPGALTMEATATTTSYAVTSFLSRPPTVSSSGS